MREAICTYVAGATLIVALAAVMKLTTGFRIPWVMVFAPILWPVSVVAITAAAVYGGRLLERAYLAASDAIRGKK